VEPAFNSKLSDIIKKCF